VLQPLVPFESGDLVEAGPVVAALAEHSERPLLTALLLIRRGGYAVGVAFGPDLQQSKVGSRYVQSRTAAGGWSQQRFARRRDNQAKAATADGAGIVGRILLPRVRDLTALVTGGDRTAVDAILAAPALAPVAALRAERFLDVPEPRHAVLMSAIAGARAVSVLVREPSRPA